MAFFEFHTHIEIDPRIQENIIRENRKDVAVTILRMIRRNFSDFQIFMEDQNVREICSEFSIDPRKYSLL